MSVHESMSLSPDVARAHSLRSGGGEATESADNVLERTLALTKEYGEAANALMWCRQLAMPTDLEETEAASRARRDLHVFIEKVRHDVDENQAVARAYQEGFAMLVGEVQALEYENRELREAVNLGRVETDMLRQDMAELREMLEDGIPASKGGAEFKAKDHTKLTVSTLLRSLN